MVNKLWRSLYSAVRLHRLAVDAYDRLDCELGIWSYPDRMIEEQELCKLKVFHRLIDQPLLSNLKHFAFCGSEHCLEELNGFLTGSRQLVQLELSLAFYGEVEVHLKLPRLKVLAFHKPNKQSSLLLDCPELCVMLYQEDPEKNLLKMKHPETIRKLETNMFGEKLVPFKGVECLVSRGETLEAIDRSSLRSLPRLKEFHYNEDISTVDRDTSFGPIYELRRRLRKFLDDVRELKGTDFQFRFFGFRMSKAMLDQIDFDGLLNYEIEVLYMKNYKLIEPDGALSFIRSVDYSYLMSVTGELPSCFYKKFTGILDVQTYGPIEDPNHLLLFLKLQILLRRLTLTRSGLGQAFYDQLPASARSLSMLFLNSENGQLNFSFIARFSRLEFLLMDAQLSWESLASLIACLDKLNKSCFSICLKDKKKRKRKEKEKKEKNF